MADPPLNPAYEKLKQIRTRTDLEARQSKYMKATFTGFDGVERPLRLRYYQIQGIMHLLAMKRFLLADDTGLGKCKPLDSLVLTDRGMLRLGDLAPKGTHLEPDTFYELDVPTQVWTGWNWAPIQRFYYGGPKPVRRVVTRRGYETVGSLVHPLWSRDGSGVEGFTKMGDSQLGDFLCLDRSLVAFPTREPGLPIPVLADIAPHAKIYTTPDHLSPGLAAFLAYVVAEGHASRWATNITQYRSINQEVHDHIRQLGKGLLGWEGDAGDKSRDTVVTISSVHIREYLLGLGVEMGLSATKRVPWPIFQGTRESVISFLRAFFDGEASVDGDILEISSASEWLLKDIQVLLLRFGIMGSRNIKAVKGYEHNTYWRLTICGDDARAFHDTIGFLTPRKQEALARLFNKKSNANLDVIPHAKTMVDSLRAEILSRSTRKGSNESRTGSGIKQFGLYFEKTLNNIRNHGSNPTYFFLHHLMGVARQVQIENTDAFQEVQSICHNHFFYDPIESIRDELADVADIEVGDPQHSFVADGFINHNTLEVIGTLCYLWEKTPDLKVVILTTKSSIEQWSGEFQKFATGITTFPCRGVPAQRKKIRDAFWAATGPSVLVMGYRTAVQDFTDLQDRTGYVFVTDEASAYKNSATQVHQVCEHLSSRADRTWALTATPIKNNLIEGWGIYKVLVPGLFGNKSHFLDNFCVTRLQQLPGTRRKVPIIVGYRAKDIQAFKETIDPYYLGRAKFEVASELPPLITKYVKVGMTPLQRSKYDDALAGLLEIIRDNKSEEKEVTKLTAVTYCQQIVNHPELIGCEGESEKLDALMELLGDGGELEGQRVIVFSRFRKMVDILMPTLKKAGIKAVRITGEEDEKERKTAQDAFQNPNSDVRVVCITTAAAEAINLQAASALVFFDTPWSGGDYLQIIGRMIRIGSIHDRCYAIHLMATGTIDERVLKVLAKKMELIESVLGKRIKGEDTGVTVDVSNDLSDLFDSLVQDARSRKAA